MQHGQSLMADKKPEPATGSNRSTGRLNSPSDEFAVLSLPADPARGNEDAWVALQQHRLYAVADGIGLRSRGLVASSLALMTLAAFFRKTAGLPYYEWPLEARRLRTDDGGRLLAGMEYAHKKLVDSSQDQPRELAMGAHVAAALLTEEFLYVASVGQARCYAYAAGSVVRVSRDNPPANSAITPVPSIAPSFAHNAAPQRPQALGCGAFEPPEISLAVIPPWTSELFLLGTRGLFQSLSEPEIAQILARNGSLEDRASALTDLALERGTTDDVSVLLVVPPRQAETPPSDGQRTQRIAGLKAP